MILDIFTILLLTASFFAMAKTFEVINNEFKKQRYATNNRTNRKR